VHARLIKAASLLLLTLAIVAAGAAVLTQSTAASSSAPVDPGLTLTATPDTARGDLGTRLAAHLAVPGATLQVSRRYVGAAEFTWLRTVVTDAAGDASWATRPTSGATYRVEFAGGGEWAPASFETFVAVRPKLTLRAAADGAVFTGDPVTLRVAVAPASPGAAVEVQRWDAGASAWAAVTPLTLKADSTARWTWHPSRAGAQRLRVRIAADAGHLAAVSDVCTVEVFDASNPYGVPSSYPHLILVDLSQYKLYYYERGRVVRVFDCVLGRPSLPTPVGHFRIYAKDAHMYGAYGPRRLRYLGAYAAHGTNEPWLLDRYPRNYSHGCTRLSNAHILWLFDRVHVGTAVWNVP
jgi:lipoprotein-anchoring transpeptidase ErfK/SrfK